MLTTRRWVGAALLITGLMSIGGADWADAVPGDEFPVTYSPTTGPTGTVVAVSGSGCTPPAGGSAAVRAFLNPIHVVGSGNPDATGAFAFDAPIEHEFMPQLPPFPYDGEFRCDLFDSESNIVNTFFSAFDFEVTLPVALPSSTGVLTLDTASAAPGDTVGVTAPASTDSNPDGTDSGYIAGQAVKLVVYPGARLVGTATAGSGGLDAEFAVPADLAAGDYTVVGYGDFEEVSPSFTALTAPLTVSSQAVTTTTSTTVPSGSTTTTSTTTAVAAQPRRRRHRPRPRRPLDARWRPARRRCRPAAQPP